MQRGIKELEKRLHTTSLGRQEEASIIKEINQVKDSVPVFKKIDNITAKIVQLKKERSEVTVDLPQINKIAYSIKQKIGEIKQKDNVFGNEKKLYQIDLVNMNSKMDGVQEKIGELRDKKRALKEDFYGQKCDYEVQ